MIRLVNPSGVDLLCRFAGRTAPLPAGGTLLLEDFVEPDGTKITAKQQADRHTDEHRHYGVTAESVADEATAPEAGSSKKRK